MLRFRRSSDARGSTPSSAQIMSTASQPLYCVRPQQKSSFISLTQWERPGSNNHSHSRCQNRGDPEMKTENMSFFDFSNFTFSSSISRFECICHPLPVIQFRYCSWLRSGVGLSLVLVTITVVRKMIDEG